MKLGRNIALVLAGLAVGAVGVEAAFRARDHGAFPHLNVYVADPGLAVRLRPGATERVSFSNNPVTNIHINAEGYRDASSGATSDVLVLGDSQAFGLGVEEEQRFSNVLAGELKRSVANVAVPTYGPAEYEAILKEELPRKKPKTVVYVVNLANDLFEASHPNTERHAVWDGWAVRKETAPQSVTSFPGRDFLYRESHAFFALRRALHDGANDAGAVPSEGTWKDIASAGVDAQKTQASAKTESGVARQKQEAKLKALLEERTKTDATLDGAIQAAEEGFEYGTGTLHATRAQPGDIVRVDYGEGSSAVNAIASELKTAADFRARLEAALKSKNDKADLDALRRQDSIDDELRTLRTTPLETLRARSPMRPFLERAAALCKGSGAELVVLVLPLDVQVSSNEWAKYHAAPIDMSASRALADDVLAVAAEVGARPIDAWPALAAAEPGAFLDGDLHMTPKGHAAVARAIATGLTQPTVSAIPAIPIGRSAMPTPDEWKAAKEPPDQTDLASDLRAFKCKRAQVREWQRFTCTAGRWKPTKPGRGEMVVTSTEHASTLVVAQIEGDMWRADVIAPSGRTEAVIDEWAIGDTAPFLHANTIDKKQTQLPLTEADRALAACAKTIGLEDNAIYGSAQPGCLAYGADCTKMIACARADDAAPPLCAPGEHVADLAHRCSK